MRAQHRGKQAIHTEGVDALASSALKAAHPPGGGGNAAASGAALAPGAHALADIVAITTRDDFLLELGAVLGSKAAVHRVESLSAALEPIGASHRARILVFDTRGMADLRNCVGRAYARAADAAIVLFTHAADAENMRRSFKDSKVFAVLPIPMDTAKTALVFADALTDALARNQPLAPRVASAPRVAASASTPNYDRWGLGAAVAVLVVACAWFIARNKEITVPGAPAAAPAHLNDRAARARAAKDEAASAPAAASQAQTAAAPAASAAPSAGGDPSQPQASLNLIHYVAPEYPAAARARNLGGAVIVAFTVDVQGATHHVRVISAEPAGVFNHDAVEAVKRWRYAPLMAGGAAVPTRTTIRFTPP
jgi:TonB family protein